jgi:hypothetical protein
MYSQEKMQKLMYRLTKEAARDSYQDLLDDLNISDEEYDEIKAAWLDLFGVIPYV